MPLEHWKHYLALENDLHTIARYVEPTPLNYPAFSVELTKLFLSACSEVEVVCKVLCERFHPTRPRRDMDDLRKALHDRFPALHTIQVDAPKYEISLHPWQAWKDRKNPDWWGDHNRVKHQRHDAFASASLGNALASMAGLFGVLCYCYFEQGPRSVNPFFLLPLDQREIPYMRVLPDKGANEPCSG